MVKPPFQSLGIGKLAYQTSRFKEANFSLPGLKCGRTTDEQRTNNGRKFGRAIYLTQPLLVIDLGPLSSPSVKDEYQCQIADTAGKYAYGRRTPEKPTPAAWGAKRDEERNTQLLRM